MAIRNHLLLKNVEPFAPSIDFIRRGLLPVYSRAHLSRTLSLVPALFLAAPATSVFAREFREADTPGTDHPMALRHIHRLAGQNKRNPLRPVARLPAMRDAATAKPIERARKVD